MMRPRSFYQSSSLMKQVVIKKKKKTRELDVDLGNNEPPLKKRRIM